MSDCNNRLPLICGGKGKPTLIDAPCNSIRFTGITDITVTKGTAIDLVSGVHAYDGNGREIAFKVSPPSIDTNRIGKYTVTYTASGVADNSAPHIMCDNMAVHMPECDYGTAKAYRTVTVEPTDAVVCESQVCESIAGCTQNS